MAEQHQVGQRGLAVPAGETGRAGPQLQRDRLLLDERDGGARGVCLDPAQDLGPVGEGPAGPAVAAGVRRLPIRSG